MMWKRFCAGLVAGLVAASAIVLPLEPVPVSAADIQGSLDAWFDDIEDQLYYYTELYAQADIDQQAEYKSYLIALAAWRSSVAFVNNLSGYLSENETYPAGDTLFGWYKYRDEFHTGTIFLYAPDYGADGYLWLPASGSLVLYSSDLCTITGNFESINSSSDIDGFCFSGIFNGLAFNRLLKVDNLTNLRFTSLTSSGLLDSLSNISLSEARTLIPSSGVVAFPLSTSMLDYVQANLPSRVLIGSLDGQSYDYSVHVPSLPTNDLSAISQGIYNTLVVDYPQITEIWFEPDAPAPDPEYPTDFVTGIPKDWTITNPQLPTIPDLDFQIPTADFDSLDVSPIRQNLSGVGFWWDLLETVLDTTSYKGLFIAFAIIGLAIFVLWKLGA